jgi:hypothetical protein
MQVLSNYSDAVRALAINKTDKRFLNDSAAHAKIIAEFMLGNSTSDDCQIYSGRLVKECYGDALSKFSGNKIRVIIDHTSASDTIKEDFADLIASKKLSVRILNNANSQFDNVNHFFITGSGYRYELDHDQARAISNFNEPTTTEKLKVIFEKMWEASADAFQS